MLGKLRNASDVARPVEQVSPGSARRWTRWRDLRSLRGIEATPHAIAAGFAAGIAVSLSPLIGLHFVLGAALALLTRGNLLASALGTLVANPWTFPAIWLATYQVGAVLLPEHSAGQIGTETFERMAQGLAACGVDVTEGEDSLTVQGGKGAKPAGGVTIAVKLDHRIGMSFLVLGLASRKPVGIDDGAAIDTSFPGFAGLMNRLGAAITGK